MGGLGGRPFQNCFRKKFIPESEGGGVWRLSSRITIKIKNPESEGGGKGGLKVKFQRKINFDCGNIIKPGPNI